MLWYLNVSSHRFFSSGSLDFQMPSEGACHQDHTQKSIQAPPKKKSSVYPAESTESTLSRPPMLHKQPPALPPKPFNRLPNHITGKVVFMHPHIWTCDTCAHLILSHPPSLCRWRPSEAALHVSQIISSSTSKEALDLRTCREHGASFARLPEVPRPSQPCSNGRALPAVRDSTCRPPPPQPNHRGAQQDSGPHHAEVWEVRITTEIITQYGNQVSPPEYQLLMCFEKIAFISFVISHSPANQMGCSSIAHEAYFSSFSQQTNSKPESLKRQQKILKNIVKKNYYFLWNADSVL